jgi:hypothetical protein
MLVCLGHKISFVIHMNQCMFTSFTLESDWGVCVEGKKQLYSQEHIESFQF